MSDTRGWYFRLRHHVLSRAFRAWLRPNLAIPTTTVGEGYGSWKVPLALLDPRAVCYCIGVGEDTQLDEALLRLGHTVVAFDPTPRAIAHADSVKERFPQYRFVPIGVWNRDTTTKFYAPAVETWVSHSIVNLQRTDHGFEAPVRRLATLMSEARHDRIDLLKLDIEGAEHEVVEDMIQSAIYPRVLCLEFDQPLPMQKLRATSTRLRAAGYQPIAVDGWNVTWVHHAVQADN